MNNSKVTIAVNRTISLIQLIAGIFFVFIFGICTIVYLFDKTISADAGTSFLICCLVFDALGIWLIICSKKKKKLINTFKTYVIAISNDGSSHIPDIAASVGTSEDVVRKNLDIMIKKKFFQNAYIDQSANCIVISSNKAVQNVTASNAFENKSQASKNNTSASAEMVTVKCNGCGAVNTIEKGKTGECDYCGSVIKGE
ncbi:MAG: hypothetical protein Q4F63_02105 [Clostridia bacterium]|nr:hypothetical protein [Clostridia bacterium]